MKTAGCLKSFSMHNNGFLIHLVMLLLLGFCASASHATTPSAAPVSASTTKHEEVARMVLGILSYTKWQPPQTVIHLCLVAPTRYAALLENISLPDNGPKLIVSKQNYDVSTLNSHCDVIYFGDISPIQQQKVLGVRQNRPVLTISELNSNCDLGSIFCLDVESSPVSFKVNLDALAQSGVHINPNVLLLGRKKKVSP
jgi:hypothetical protein